MNSLWEQTSTHRDFPRLERDVKTRVLIIGGGMAGVLCLRQLRDRGVDCVLAEGNRIGMGITKGTDIYVRKVAPLGDPIEVTVRGFELSLRKDEAQNVLVS